MPKEQSALIAGVLTELADEYRHYQQDHQRKGVASAPRNALKTKMEQVADRFNRLLTHWVADDALKAAWTQYLHEGGEAPNRPQLSQPPEYRGRTEAGSVVAVRASVDGGYDLVVDGTIEKHERVPWHLDPDMIEPVQLGEHTCWEFASSPRDAMEALREFVDTPDAEPPWNFARVLFEDGLIDQNFGLTPRGYRLLGKTTPRAVGPEAAVTFGVLVANATRARVFLLDAPEGEYAPTLTQLVEVSQSTRPEQRAKDSEVFSDSRPGARLDGPHGSGHGVSDRRDGARRMAEQRFADQVVEEALRIFDDAGVTRVVFVAGPSMLGLLRPAVARKQAGQTQWRVSELPRELSRLSPSALHDALAAAGHLPARSRRPGPYAVPGLPYPEI